MSDLGDLNKINDFIVGAAASDVERSDMLASLAALDAEFQHQLIEFLSSEPQAPALFLENYRKKKNAQVSKDPAIWEDVLNEEKEQLDSIPE